jgi:hypothetical protein
MKDIEIRVKGHLDTNWGDWLENMTFTHTNDGDTLLRGPVDDQSVLYGLLNKLSGLGMQLISLNPVQTTLEKAAGPKASRSDSKQRIRVGS